MCVEDPYLWFENISDPKVLEWIDRKNRVFRERFGGLSDKLLPRVLHYQSYPVVVQLVCAGEQLFTLERLSDRFVVYRIKGSEKVPIIDSKSLGKDMVIHGIDTDMDGRFLAVRYSPGTDVGVAKIIDVESGEEVDRLEGDVRNFTWIDRNRYYYVRFYREGKTPDGVEAPASRVMLREVGGKEEMVFGEGIQSKHMLVVYQGGLSNKVFIIDWYGWSRNWIYAGNVEDCTTWRLLYDPGDTYALPIEYVNGEYYLAVFDGGGMGRIIAVSESGAVRQVVVEDPQFPLDGAVMCGNEIVANYLVHASSRLRIYTLSGKLVKEVTFDKPGTVSNMQSCKSFCAFLYTSFDTPYSIYMYRDGVLRILDEKRVGNICVDEHFVTSFDGTPIHVFHVYSCGKRSGKAMLMGYGGFNISLTPRYIDYVALFVEDGGEFFMANIRGGGEYGKKWHEAAIREKRENTYRDFAAVIKWLKSQGYKVVIHGRSNGGLLCGVMYVRYPDLLDGAVIGYPLLDMLRFHKLYIGSLWIPEYGDPDNPRDREYLLKISPYHNIRRSVKYPPCMIYTGLHDDRVHPGHALKFAAKLDEVGAENYLRVETSTGHIGGDPVIVAKEKADILAFVYYVLQLNTEQKS